MTLTETLARGRVKAEARMGAENGASTVRVRRLTGQTTRDPVSDLDVPGWVITHDALPFRLSGSNRGASPHQERTGAGVEISTGARFGSCPASTTDLADNDYIEVIAGENTGEVLRVVEATWQDQATARRFPLTAERRPEEWT